jgi:monoamine oxidase
MAAQMSDEGRVDCVVVGAGFSGLAAATALVEAGRSVVVVEARDRVGGRVRTVHVGGSRTCVGAQWIGPQQSRMLALADQARVTRFPTHIDGTKVLELGGLQRTYTSHIPSLPWLHLAELQLLLWRIDRMTATVSVADAHTDRPELDGLTVEGFKRQHAWSPRVRGLIDAMVRVVFGMEASDLSLLRFLQYLRSGGGLDPIIEVDGGAQEQRVAEGTHAIAQYLADALGDRVHLSSPVRQIDWCDGVRVRTDGGTFLGRHAILAIPPHLVGRIHWEPALPADRDHLLQQFPMGQTIKVFLQYETAFWRDAGMSGEVVCDAMPVSIAYDNTTLDGQPGLLGFVVGGHARQFGAMSEDARRAAVIDCFVRWFGADAGSPTAYHEEDWGLDPWSGGCPTSSPSPGTLAAYGHLLRAPMGAVHWAGTEVATEWTGYMEGAVQAGRAAAQQILAKLD